jgi:hypothetical protein
MGPPGGYTMTIIEKNYQSHLEFQRLQKEVLRASGKFPMCTAISDLHSACKITKCCGEPTYWQRGKGRSYTQNMSGL